MKRAHLFLLAAVFVALRLALFNINIAEWGDSYDFLRIAESITRGEYPPDAKRLPVFPLLIAVGIPFLDAVVWAKIVVLLASAGGLFLTCRLTRRLFPDLSANWLLAAGYLLLFSPIFLYWSIRVVAEPVFAFWVLLAFNLFYDPPRFLRGLRQVAFMGADCGLAAMTRYEGFLLFGALGLGLLTRERGERRGILLSLVLYSVAFVLVISPWLLRNYLVFGTVFYTLYSDDPAGFLNAAFYRWQWLSYAVFLFGFPWGFWWLVRGLGLLRQKWLHYLPIFAYVVLSLALFFVWCPRSRFYIPLLLLLSGFVVAGFRASTTAHRDKLFPFAAFALLALHTFVTLKYRFYFLGAGGVSRAAVLGLGLAAVLGSVLFAALKRLRAYLPKMLFLTTLVCEIFVSFGVISNRRLMYSSVYQAATDPVLSGELVVFSDETGVSSWYLRGNSLKYDENLLVEEQWRWFESSGACFVLWTNEHEEGSRLSVVTDPEFSARFELVEDYVYYLRPSILEGVLPEKLKRHNAAEEVRESRIYQLKKCQS